MTKASKTKNTEISDIAQLAAWLEEGCDDKQDLVIGTENEKIVFNAKTLSPARYEEISKFLTALQDYGWTPVYEGENLIGLERDSANISLEPAGQVELSGACFKDVHGTADEVDQHISEVNEKSEQVGLNMIGLGYHPTHSRQELPLVPKSRYKSLLDLFLDRDLTRSIDMLVSTSSIQVNLGFSSEEDMVKKLRVGLSLQPIVVALFANSPFKDGKPSGYQSYRSHINQNSIEGRYGFMLPVAFEEGFGFERYAQYALSEFPMIGVYQDDKFVSSFGDVFQEFIEGKLDICDGHKATMRDWEDHLNCIWPEVRLRRSLEMRGADAGPAEMIKALPAFWVGLMYDETSLNAAYDIIEDWTNEEREYLRTVTPKYALQTDFRGEKIQELAKKLLALSEQGLKRRNIKNDQGQDESCYLEPLFEIANSGQTLAQKLLDLYDNEWDGDMSRLYNDFNYVAEKKKSLSDNKKMKEERKPKRVPPKPVS